MMISADAILGAFAVGLLAAIGAYVATVKWIAKIDKAKVDHAVCSRRRTECPCHKEIKDHIEIHNRKGFRNEN